MDELMVIAPTDFPLMSVRGSVHPDRVSAICREWMGL
jgi:hypothetical protein